MNLTDSFTDVALTITYGVGQDGGVEQALTAMSGSGWIVRIHLEDGTSSDVMLLGYRDGLVIGRDFDPYRAGRTIPIETVRGIHVY